MERSVQRRRSSYDLHLRRNSGYNMAFEVDNDSIISDTGIIRDDLRELSVEIDEGTIGRMQSMGIDRTFSIANQAAELIRARRRQSLANLASKTKYIPPESNPHYQQEGNIPMKRSESPKSKSRSLSMIKEQREYDEDDQNNRDHGSLDKAKRDRMFQKSNQDKRNSYIGVPPRPRVHIPSLPGGPELSLDPNGPVGLDQQRALNIIRTLHTLENDIYPPTRIAIEKLLQHLRIQYSRAPTRFVHRLLGLPSSTAGNRSESMSEKSWNTSGRYRTTILSTDEQMKEIKAIINNRRYVTYDIFAAMIHNVRPDQIPTTIKELFDLLAEKKEYVEPEPISARLTNRRSVSSSSPSKKYLMIVDIWSFLTLLKTSKEEARCVYNMKSSKLQHILEHLDKFNQKQKNKSDQKRMRDLAFVSVGTYSSGGVDHSNNHRENNQSEDDEIGSTISAPVIVKTSFTQTTEPSYDNRRRRSHLLIPKENQTTFNVSDGIVPSIIDLGNIRSSLSTSSTSSESKYRRKYSLFPYNSSKTTKQTYIDHYDTTIDTTNRRRVKQPTAEDMANMNMAATLNMNRDQTCLLSYTDRKPSPHRKKVLWKEWTSDLSDQHPSVLNGVGAAMALGKTFDRKDSHESDNTGTKKNRDFRYKQNLVRELNQYTPMDKILKES